MSRLIRNMVKLILFEGVILKKMSKFAYLNKRSDAISIIAFGKQITNEIDEKTEEKAEDKKRNMVPLNCKIMV